MAIGDGQRPRILIIANARYKGGASGSDKIYESFQKYWPCSFSFHRVECDYKPFIVCYLQRIFVSFCLAIFEPQRFSFVYTSSDFIPDVISGCIFRLRGYKWVAGYFLHAPKENKAHFYTQKICRWLITKFSDMVIVTNPTMYPIFPTKKKTWINGGIDLKLAGLSDEPKIYDAVWCGRIHYTKGVDELIEIWSLVRKEKPTARLALIGDGDLGLDYVRKRIKFHFGNAPNGIDLLGYMGDERYKIYKQSRVVIYPVIPKYTHFSMAPIEAMACGCTMNFFRSPVMDFMFNIKIPLPNIWDRQLNVKQMAKDILRDLDSDHYVLGSAQSRDYAKQFDYEKQSLRVYSEVMSVLGN